MEPPPTETYTLSLHDALPIYTLWAEGSFLRIWNPEEFYYICTGYGRKTERDAMSTVGRTFGEYMCFTYF